MCEALFRDFRPHVTHTVRDECYRCESPLICVVSIGYIINGKSNYREKAVESHTELNKDTVRPMNINISTHLDTSCIHTFNLRDGDWIPAFRSD